RSSRESGFGSLTANVDFNENRERLSQFLRGATEPARQAERVDGIDCVEQLHCITGLVALQMTDHVAAKVRQVAKCLGLFLAFLDTVFAEKANPSIVCLAYPGNINR